MEYCAKTNTAEPKTGFISMGEILTDEQAAALGEEKLQELVRRGVLEATGDKNTEHKITPHAEEKDVMPEEMPEEAQEENADDDDALLTLDAEDVLSTQPTEKPKKRGGRKAK